MKENGIWFLFGYTGRISRSSFIKTFVVYSLIILVLIGIKYLSLNNPTSDTSVTIGYALKIARVFVYWFFIAQCVKRCHDIGKSGWWMFIPLFFIWLLFAKGDEHDNEYGEVPQ
jgi:uncharacterized membrane protein YhaH (DUF805 family)